MSLLDTYKKLQTPEVDTPSPVQATGTLLDTYRGVKSGTVKLKTEQPTFAPSGRDSFWSPDKSGKVGFRDVIRELPGGAVQTVKKTPGALLGAGKFLLNMFSQGTQEVTKDLYSPFAMKQMEETQKIKTDLETKLFQKYKEAKNSGDTEKATRLFNALKRSSDEQLKKEDFSEVINKTNLQGVSDAVMAGMEWILPFVGGTAAGVVSKSAPIFTRPLGTVLAEQFAKVSTKQGLKSVGKMLGIEASWGATYGALGSLQTGETKPGKIALEAGKMALLAPVFAGVSKLGLKGINELSGKIGNLLKKPLAKMTPEEIKVVTNEVENIAKTEAKPVIDLYHGDINGKLKVDERGNINFGTSEDVKRFNDNNTAIKIDTSKLNIKQVGSQKELSDIGNSQEMKNKLISEGIDVVATTDQAIGINPEIIKNKTGLNLYDRKVTTIEDIKGSEMNDGLDALSNEAKPLYRELSFKNFLDDASGRLKYEPRYFHENIDLALGQGENKGVIIKLGKKPQFIKSGKGSVGEKLVTNPNYKEEIESIFVPKGMLTDKTIEGQRARLRLKNNGFELPKEIKIAENVGVTRKGQQYVELKNTNYNQPLSTPPTQGGKVSQSEFAKTAKVSRGNGYISVSSPHDEGSSYLIRTTEPSKYTDAQVIAKYYDSYAKNSGSISAPKTPTIIQKETGSVSKPESNIVALNPSEQQQTHQKIKPKTILENLTDITKKSEIRKNISEKLKVPIRVGQNKKNALGYLKVKEEVIRIKSADDIETISHEVGHLIEKRSFGTTKRGGTGLTGEAFRLPPEARKELMEISSKPNAASNKTAEGYAEYTRLYMTDRETAKKVAPKFTEIYEKFLNENPDLKTVVNETTAQWQKYVDQPSVNRVMSQISYEQPKEKPNLVNFLNNVYTAVFDKFHPLAVFEKQAEKLGGKLMIGPYKAARLFAGWTGKVESFLNYKTFDKNLNFNGKGLREIFSPIKTKKEGKLFDAYLASRRTLAIDKETGISKTDAQQTIDDLEKLYPQFKEITDELYKFNDRVLEYAKDSDVISGDLFNQLSQEGLDYVPLYRVMEERTGTGIGKGVTDAKSPIKRMKGSTREIISPTEGIVKNVAAIINASEKNRIGLKISELAKTEGIGGLIEEVDPKMAKIATVELGEAIRQKTGLPEEMLPPELDDLLTSLGDLNVFRPSMFKPEDNVISVLKNGKPKYYKVAPDIYKSLTAMDEESVGLAIKLASIPGSWLRAGATLSPDFAVKNPIRDIMTAFIYGKKSFFADNLFQSLKGVKKAVFKDDDYWQWVVGGGQHSMLPSMDRTKLIDTRNELMFGKDKLRYVKNPIEALRQLSEFSETGTRMGEFMRTLAGKSRESIENAAYNSREITIDFSRSGSKTKALRMMAAFWNASMQGTDRMVRSFKDNPVGSSTRAILGLTLPSVVLWTINKDNPDYRRLPQYQKDLFWHIPVGKKFIRIPKPFELGIIFASLPERMLDVMYKKDPDAIKKWTKTFISNMPGLPMPSGLVPIIENITNYSFFREGPIESDSLSQLLPEERATSYTPDAYKAASNFLKKIGITYSPVKIQNITEGYTGTLGRNVVNLISPNMYGKETNIPGVSTFIDKKPTGSRNENVSVFYDRRDKVNEIVKTVNRLNKQGQTQKAKALQIKYNKEYGKYFYQTQNNTLGNNMNKVSDQISSISKEIAKINKSNLNRDIKEKKIEILNAQIDLLAEKNL